MSFETRQRNGCLHTYTCYRLSVLGKQSHVGCIVMLLKENKDIHMYDGCFALKLWYGYPYSIEKLFGGW